MSERRQLPTVILDRPLFSHVVSSHPSPMLSMFGVDFFPACRCAGEDEGESISAEEGAGRCVWGGGEQVSSYRWREGLRGRAGGARESNAGYTFLLFISLFNGRKKGVFIRGCTSHYTLSATAAVLPSPPSTRGVSPGHRSQRRTTVPRGGGRATHRSLAC